MPRNEYTIRAARAWIDGRFQPAQVDVADGAIAGIGSSRTRRRRVVTVPDDAVLLPGLVDSHVHVNEPGRTEWEGFRSATTRGRGRPAASATLVDMPLNSLPPTTTVEALEIKRATAAASAHIDVGFWGGAVPGQRARTLAGLHDAGVFGFKCFLSPSGVEEFPHLDRAQLHAAMAEVAALGSRLIVHAEDPALFGAEDGLGAATTTASCAPGRRRARRRRSTRSSTPPAAPAGAPTSCTSATAARSRRSRRRRRPACG